MGYWRDLFTEVRAMFNSEEWAKLFDTPATRFERDLAKVAPLADHRDDLRQLALDAARLGLRRRDLQPMAHYWHVHPIKCDAAHAWEHGYRDGISVDSWSKQNPYKEEK